MEEREVRCDDFPALLAATAWQEDGDRHDIDRRIIVQHVCGHPLEHIARMEQEDT